MVLLSQYSAMAVACMKIIRGKDIKFNQSEGRDRMDRNKDLPEEAKARIEEAAKAAAMVRDERQLVFISVAQAFENGLQIGSMLQEKKEKAG